MSRKGDKIIALPTGRFRARLVTLRGRQTRNFPTYALAEEWLAATRTDDARQRREVARGLPKPGEYPTLAAFADAWYAERESEWAYSTREGYQDHLAMIRTSALGALRVDRLTFREVEAWLAELVAASRADGRYRYGAVTLAGALRTLRQITRRMMVEHRLAHWCCDTVRVPKLARKRRNPRRPAFTARELAAFLTALEAPCFVKGGWRALFWILAATGARPCEVLALRRRHVDLDAGVILLEDSAYRGFIRAGTKTGDPRRPAIPAELAAVLRPHLDGLAAATDALLFPPEHAGSKRARRLPPGATLARGGDTLDRPFRHALADAAIDKPGLTPYSLRNTFNTLALRLGADGITLRDVMGHSTASMTERYARTDHGDRAALQSMVMAEVTRH